MISSHSSLGKLRRLDTGIFVKERFETYAVAASGLLGGWPMTRWPTKPAGNADKSDMRPTKDLQLCTRLQGLSCDSADQSSREERFPRGGIARPVQFNVW